MLIKFLSLLIRILQSKEKSGLRVNMQSFPLDGADDPKNQFHNNAQPMISIIGWVFVPRQMDGVRDQIIARNRFTGTKKRPKAIALGRKQED